ncbi:DUF3488 domain-containing protein [Pyxidicoccus xibeiensis]|uniref:DUF3488 domain-containing protein n=1 Tax=Pyxidicoccus xibeiensis TaxID=2906759 RepID=UPI0020A80AC8|nr:DUF3488 domain-containing protein [Pyxidicoccus xibeiensis]MCP3138215.1 DUF3488 domain-containing protein [Pyxidicoccus xibeiensis]
MICPACARLRADESGAPCPECGGALVSPSEAHLEALVQATLKRNLQRWHSDGLLDGATAARLEASLGAAAEGPEPVPPEPATPAPADSALRLEAWADEVAESLRRAAGWRPGWGSQLARSLEETAQAEREQAARRREARGSRGEGSEDDLGSALGSGQALFSQGQTGALGGGLEAVVALDDVQAGSPRLHEYIWWFLGAVLVLGGSLMGVREAWRALGGVPRQLLVTGALFGYHAAFIGLGVFLSRRSLSAGRVLAGIGVALLPVVFVALSALVALSPMLGGAVALGVAGLGLLPLRAAGRLLHGTSVASLAVALWPSLLAGLPLMGFEEAPWLRALCASAGVVALGASVWRARTAKEKAPLAPLVSAGAALYGALCLALFCVASAPGGFDALEPGNALFTGMAAWAMALAAVVAFAATSDSVREAYPRAGAVVETLAHAMVASGALAGALGAFSAVPGEDTWVDLGTALAPAAAALVFFVLEPRRRALVHLGVIAAMLAGVLGARTLAPGEPAWWVFGSAAVSAGLLLVARVTAAPGPRARLLAWGVVGSLLAMPAVLVDWGGVVAEVWPKVSTGLLIALAAHVAGGWKWRGLHYVAGLAALFGGLVFVSGMPALSGSASSLAVFALAGALYGLAGLAQDAWARRTGRSDDLLPLDDLSLVMASLGVVLAVGVMPALPGALVAFGLQGVLLACAPTAVATGVLLLRVRRDASTLVGFLAACGLALVVSQVTGTVSDFTSPRAALVAASLMLGFVAFAALRGPRPEPAVPPAAASPLLRGRKVLGALRLPFSPRGLPLFTEGFAVVALVQAVIATGTLVQWIPVPVDAERPGFLLAGGLLTAGALGVFVSRGFVSWRLRGSVVTLAASGGFIALTAIINRAGRPLPPDVTAWRTPLIGLALWGVALATRRFGPALGRLLENPRHGPLYHAVPHVGVAALGLVLLRGAVSVGMPDPSRALGVVPPLLLLGAALLALLLAYSFRSVWLVHAGLVLGLPGAALWAARQSLLGPGLVALLPPDGQWVYAEAVRHWGSALDWLQPEAWLTLGDSVFLLWQRALAGVAAAGLVYAGAVFGLPYEPLRQALRRQAVTALWLVCAAAFFQPGVTSAALVFATGALLFLGGAQRQGRGALGVGGLLLVHAFAHRSPVFESWPGPLLAAAGLAVVVLAPWVARRRGADVGEARVRGHRAALLCLTVATVYALAVGGDTSSVMAVPNLVAKMFTGLGGDWMVSAALPVTLALFATALFVAAFQWKGAFAGFVAGWGSGVAGSAVVSALMAAIAHRALQSGSWVSYADLLTVHGAALALAAAGSALALHVGQQVTRGRRSDVAGGLGGGRDSWLVVTGVLLAVVAVGGQALEGALPLAISAIGVAVLVSLHCAWREHTGRHVYYVQVAVVGVYALVRGLYAPGLRREHDALFALALGFVLVGVTVLARRAGVQPVEAATRRFAALLPVGVALVLPGDATGEAALLAGGSGLLYAALGAVERSRMFGAFSAAACNLALLIAALAYGLEGLEVYLAPLGLLLLMLGQLFTSSLPHAARNAVRILGGLLLYVPAAAKLTMRVGASEDGTYALVFGGVCLLGVAVGMALQIRAYLALGTLFLTLDVVANLLDAGLRDHRIGFLVMTLTGLSIVGARVLATLRRQELDLLVQRVRVQLRGWD